MATNLTFTEDKCVRDMVTGSDLATGDAIVVETPLGGLDGSEWHWYIVVEKGNTCFTAFNIGRKRLVELPMDKEYERCHMDITINRKWVVQKQAGGKKA